MVKAASIEHYPPLDHHLSIHVARAGGYAGLVSLARLDRIGNCCSEPLLPPVAHMGIPNGTNMTNSIRAAPVYLRVSTDEQDLTRQEAIVAGARAQATT